MRKDQNVRTERLVINDLDRTLLDTDRAVLALQIACAQSGLDMDHFSAVKTATEATVGSFDAWGYIKGMAYEDEILETVRNNFLTISREFDLLYRDTRPYLQALG